MSVNICNIKQNRPHFISAPYKIAPTLIKIVPTFFFEIIIVIIIITIIIGFENNIRMSNNWDNIYIIDNKN
jgi:hypothetical protein